MMLEDEQGRCFAFAQILLGKLANKDDIETLTATVSSLGEFCVALVLRYEDDDPRACEVAEVWRKRVGEAMNDNHVNDLVHTGEILAMKRTELEQKIHEATKEMLEKLKVIDGLATIQAEMRERLSEIDDLIVKFRLQYARFDGVALPAQGARNESGK